MRHLSIVIQTELLKVIKSKVIWMTALMFTLAPLVGGFFMYILKDPDSASSSGLLGAKAQIAGEASWPSFIMVQGQMIAVGGIIVYGFITSWLFGREFADRTVKDLLSLPYSRGNIVIGKFITAFIVHSFISIYIISIGMLFGAIIKLPGWQEVLSEGHLQTLFLVTFLTIILSTPVAFFATISRGYLGAIGFIVIIIILSQLITTIGYGDLFPWALPAMLSGMVDPAGMQLTINQWIMLLITSFLGIISTIYSWLFIDYSS